MKLITAVCEKENSEIKLGLYKWGFIIQQKNLVTGEISKPFCVPTLMAIECRMEMGYVITQQEWEDFDNGIRFRDGVENHINRYVDMYSVTDDQWRPVGSPESDAVIK